MASAAIRKVWQTAAARKRGLFSLPRRWCTCTNDLGDHFSRWLGDFSSLASTASRTFGIDPGRLAAARARAPRRPWPRPPRDHEAPGEEHAGSGTRERPGGSARAAALAWDPGPPRPGAEAERRRASSARVSGDGRATSTGSPKAGAGGTEGFRVTSDDAGAFRYKPGPKPQAEPRHRPSPRPSLAWMKPVGRRWRALEEREVYENPWILRPRVPGRGAHRGEDGLWRGRLQELSGDRRAADLPRRPHRAGRPIPIPVRGSLFPGRSPRAARQWAPIPWKPPKRELREEAGLTAQTWTLVLSFHSFQLGRRRGGSCGFIATNLHETEAETGSHRGPGPGQESRSWRPWNKRSRGVFRI